MPLKLVRLPFRHFRERGIVRLEPDTTCYAEAGHSIAT